MNSKPKLVAVLQQVSGRSVRNNGILHREHKRGYGWGKTDPRTFIGAVMLNIEGHKLRLSDLQEWPCQGTAAHWRYL